MDYVNILAMKHKLIHYLMYTEQILSYIAQYWKLHSLMSI